MAATRDIPATLLDERALADAVADNVYALFRAMEVVGGYEREERPGVHAHHAPPRNPMFKGVWGITGEASAEEVDAALAWVAGRGAPFAFVWADHRTPGWLSSRASRLGVEPFDVEAPGLAACLDDLDWSLLEAPPEGLTTETVADEEGVHVAADMLVRAFGMPEWAASGWVDATLDVGVAEAPWSFVLGRLDGEPVATTVVFNGAGVASVFGVGTVPEHRGKRIGAAITLAGYDLSRREGYRYGVLFSTDLGLPVYRRLGFRDCGIGISRWLWRADDA